MPLKIAHLILAAGGSTRMGQPKQLIEWKGETLVNHAIKKAQQTEVETIYVVLGANAEKIKETISDYNIQIIFNSVWQKGLGSSISVGINYITKHGKYDGVLIRLIDNPTLALEHYRQLIALFKSKRLPIVASEYNDTHGVPAIFGGEFFEALQQLQTDKGAKSIMKQYWNQVLFLKSDTDFVDLDTPEDLKKIQSQ